MFIFVYHIHILKEETEEYVGAPRTGIIYYTVLQVKYILAYVSQT